MKIIVPRSKTLWLVVIAVLTSFSIQPLAVADMISTEQLVNQAQTEAKKIEVMNLLARDDVRARMIDLGVDMNDAQTRINSMTDTELNEVHASLDTLPAGGDALGAVLTLLLIFLILDLAGVTDIFPGV